MTNNPLYTQQAPCGYYWPNGAPCNQMPGAWECFPGAYYNQAPACPVPQVGAVPGCIPQAVPSCPKGALGQPCMPCFRAPPCQGVAQPCLPCDGASTTSSSPLQAILSMLTSGLTGDIGTKLGSFFQLFISNAAKEGWEFVVKAAIPVVSQIIYDLLASLPPAVLSPSVLQALLAKLPPEFVAALLAIESFLPPAVQTAINAALNGCGDGLRSCMQSCILSQTNLSCCMNGCTTSGNTVTGGNPRNRAQDSTQ